MATKKDFEELFKLADKDSNGFLTLKELINQMKTLGYKGSENALKEHFQLVDTDGNHKLNLEEFVSCMSKAPPYMHRTALMRRLFSRFDKDASGRLNRQELQRATEMLGDRFGDEDTAILLSIIDKDNSDDIDVEEFIKSFIELKS